MNTIRNAAQALSLAKSYVICASDSDKLAEKHRKLAAQGGPLSSYWAKLAAENEAKSADYIERARVLREQHEA